MYFQGTTAIVFSLIALSEATPFAGDTLFRRSPLAFPQGQGQGKGNQGGNAGNAAAAANGGATPTCLAAKAVQTGSQSDGNQVPADGQAASAT